MKRSIKAVLTIAFAAGIMAAMTATVSAAPYRLAIDEKNFPDPNFRTYLLENHDDDFDGYLSEDEIKKVDVIACKGLKIKSLDGIENFTELVMLECSENEIASLDTTKNPKLATVICISSGLKSIKLGKSDKLTYLFVHNNQLASLDLSGCPNLKAISVYLNPIKKLDISKQLYLQMAYVYGIKKADLKDVDGLIYTDYYMQLTSGNRMSKMTETIFVMTDDKIKIDTGSSKVPDDIGLIEFKSGGMEKKCGEFFYVSYTYKDLQSSVKWKSSDPNVISVSDTGCITCKMAGTATITAYADGASATMTVTSLYKDVTNKKDFWYTPTNYLTAKGTVKGYNKQTMFKPGNDCTRAQMVTFLYRLQGEPKTKSTTCKFTDVKKTDYFFKPVIWAVEKGITTGVSKTKFDPKGVCTRAQTVTFLWRMAKKPSIGTAKNPFKDVKSKDYFYNAVIWASNKKIVAGYSDGTFRPQGKCLRRQMVTFLYKYDKFINKEK